MLAATVTSPWSDTHVALLSVNVTCHGALQSNGLQQGYLPSLKLTQQGHLQECVAFANNGAHFYIKTIWTSPRSFTTPSRRPTSSSSWRTACASRPFGARAAPRPSPQARDHLQIPPEDLQQAHHEAQPALPDPLVPEFLPQVDCLQVKTIFNHQFLPVISPF